MKTANLKKVTMKTLMQDVQNKYPGVDLSSRKSYMKGIVEDVKKSFKFSILLIIVLAIRLLWNCN